MLGFLVSAAVMLLVRHRRLLKAFLFLGLSLSVLPVALSAQTVTDTQPEALPAQPHPKGWWPNDGAASRGAYTGPAACASCHPSIAASCALSEMAHAMTPAAHSTFLRTQPHISYHRGRYTYRLDLQGDQAIYSVTDGQQTLSVPLLWAYGTGVVGQAFVFQSNGSYYEAEVAFYPVLRWLDVVAGVPPAAPPALEQAFGLPLVPAAAQQCIACHTTAAVTNHRLEVSEMIRGVTCEACHGPGARHVAVMKALSKGSKPAVTFIFNPGRLTPAEQDNFCGACHRTSLLVIREGLHGLGTVHYEPYRLEMSQCWIMSQRITCLTCHGPHRQLERRPAAYDAACLSCHARQGIATSSGMACPVARQDCVSCHMPKCHLPLAPFTMSDHFIRIVRPGDACTQS